MSCSQNFSAIIRSITKKTDGGENPFIGFSNIVEMDEQRDQIVDSIADKIADESRKSTETILSYDFNAIGKQLKKLSDKKYKGLTEDVVSEIISRIQLKLTKDEDLFLTNPIILKEDGSSDLLFDFSNISNLTGGIQSMENFIDSELQSGLFKATFIDTSDNVGSEEYEPFVVTNTDLNKNLLIYKNELWSYIVSTAVSLGKFNKKLKDTKLYENGKSRAAIVAEYDLTPSALDRWIKQAQTSGSFKEKDNRSTEENELIALRKELQHLRMENDILKQAALIMGRK